MEIYSLKINFKVKSFILIFVIFGLFLGLCGQATGCERTIILPLRGESHAAEQTVVQTKTLMV
jgi:hypothetical protein